MELKVLRFVCVEDLMEDNMSRKQLILLIVGVIALITVTAAASAYVTRDAMTPDKPKIEKVAVKKTKAETISWNEVKPQPQPVQQKSTCNDGNIVGAAVGAVGGGLVGKQFGKGKGNDLATIGGALAGGYAGHQMIPTRNVLCP